MIGATLFSGIGAPEASAPWIDWRWSSDIDDFANAVRAHHWPDVPNLGDVSEINGGDLERPDVLVFGSPCQSFSVAGKRLGLDDPRGNLALVALGLVDAIRPNWFVFENVPGLLSSDDGRDFAAFCNTVTECGYGWAWRVLDAQFAGVPQRRRRIFFVGHSGGDWRAPGAVLFEPESLRGNPPPSRKTREPVAAHASNGVGTCGADDNQAQAGHLIAHTLRGEGFDASEGGTERGAPIVAIQERATSENPAAGPDGAGFRSDGQAYTLEARQVPQAVAFDTAQITSKANCTAGEDGTGRGISIIAVHGTQNPITSTTTANPVQTNHGQETVIAFSSKDYGADVGETSPTLRAMGHDGSHANGGGQVAVAFDTAQITSKANRTRAEPGLPSSTLAKGSRMQVAMPATVRRLTPTECERLQGFPDGFTDIPWRKGRALDGRRYKALGNSMAVPVVGWVLDRVGLYEKIDGDN